MHACIANLPSNYSSAFKVYILLQNLMTHQLPQVSNNSNTATLSAVNLEVTKLDTPVEEKTFLGRRSCELVTGMKYSVPTVSSDCELVVQGLTRSYNAQNLSKNVSVTLV